MITNSFRALPIFACFSVLLVSFTPARAQQINDQNGNSFMEEIGTPSTAVTKNTVDVRTLKSSQTAPSQKIPVDLSNVGVATDERGNIIPLINREGYSVQPQGGGIQAYNEIPALTAPYNINGMPFGAPGTTFVQTGPLMSVPNPYYAQPNINLRVGPMNFSNRPFYPYGYAPPARILTPIAPNSTTTFSTPFSSGSVTNTTQTFGPSLTPPPTMP